MSVKKFIPRSLVFGKYSRCAPTHFTGHSKRDCGQFSLANAEEVAVYLRQEN